MQNKCHHFFQIIDFGLSRCESDEMTGYVATRWYRAPELILNEMKYTKAMDLWSVGCILAEMFTKTALFQGKNCEYTIKLSFNRISNRIIHI